MTSHWCTAPHRETKQQTNACLRSLIKKKGTVYSFNHCAGKPAPVNVTFPPPPPPPPSKGPINGIRKSSKLKIQKNLLTSSCGDSIRYSLTSLIFICESLKKRAISAHAMTFTPNEHVQTLSSKRLLLAV